MRFLGFSILLPSDIVANVLIPKSIPTACFSQQGFLLDIVSFVSTKIEMGISHHNHLNYQKDRNGGSCIFNDFITYHR